MISKHTFNHPRKLSHEDDRRLEDLRSSGSLLGANNPFVISTKAKLEKLGTGNNLVFLATRLNLDGHFNADGQKWTPSQVKGFLDNYIAPHSN